MTKWYEIQSEIFFPSTGDEKSQENLCEGVEINLGDIQSIYEQLRIFFSSTPPILTLVMYNNLYL